MNEKINDSKDMQPILDALLEVSKENMKNLILDSACQKQEIYKMIEEILERELAKFSNAMKAMLEAKSREFSEKIAFMEARDAQRLREMETIKKEMVKQWQVLKDYANATQNLRRILDYVNQYIKRTNCGKSRKD